MKIQLIVKDKRSIYYPNCDLSKEVLKIFGRSSFSEQQVKKMKESFWEIEINEKEIK